MSTSDGIVRVGTDGANPEVIARSYFDGDRLAWAAQSGMIYFASAGIWRIAPDGTGLEAVRAEIPHLGDFVIDEAGDKIYWTEEGFSYDDLPALILRADLDGSNVDTLLTEADGLDEPERLAIDFANEMMYWTGGGFGDVMRARLDGTGMEETDLESSSTLAIDPDGGKVYYTDNDALWRANLDGSDAEELVTDVVDPNDIVVDATAGTLYWTEDGNRYSDPEVPARMRRAALDGSNVEVLLTSAEEEMVPSGFTLDPATGALYWSETGIHRADSDGANADTIVRFDRLGPNNPRGVAVDRTNEVVYWVSYGRNDFQDASLQRMALDGAGQVETLLTADDGLVDPQGLALDVDGGMLYWTDKGSNAVGVDAYIGRAALDGSTPETLVTLDFSETGTNRDPEALALDLTNGTMYWADRPASLIQRANLDGSDVETVIDDVDGRLHAVGVDAASGTLYWGTGTGIYRAGLDGSAPAPFVTQDDIEPQGFVIDAEAGTLSWAYSLNWSSGGGIQQAHLDGTGDVTTVLETEQAFGIALGPAGAPSGTPVTTLGERPDRLVLRPNYPNPFSRSTTIRYVLPEAAHVRIDLFDALGRRVAVLADGRQTAGSQAVHFDAGAAGTPAGVYFYRIEAGSHAATGRMVLVQ